MILDPAARLDSKYPVVVIGTGFGSLFFVHRLLERRPDMKVLMLERGGYRPWSQQLEEDLNSSIPAEQTFNATGEKKPWNFTIAVGGGTNCWYGSTLRMHPNDFRMRSLYGRAQDWPVSYDALEPYYAQAERIMDISGPDDICAISPRSGPYPQPPHKMSAVDRAMKRAQPGLHFTMPTVRARVANEQRAQCCASFRCWLCPVEAKFTAHNGFRHILEHPNVLVLPEAEVRAVDRVGGSVTGVGFRRGGRDERVGCDLCVLGANAIHSAAILLRSGFDEPKLGRGLNEQLGFGVEVMLDGLDNLDGSTITTGHNYSLYDGPFRASHAAVSLVFENRYPYGLRPELGRWRQLVAINPVIESDPLDENRVTVDDDGEVEVHFEGHGSLAKGGVARVLGELPRVLAPLPVENIEFKGLRGSESHLQGTVRMGANPAESVVDHALVHHGVRNLVVVGTGVLPTCPPVAPSLTAAALSLRAADRYCG